MPDKPQTREIAPQSAGELPQATPAAAVDLHQQPRAFPPHGDLDRIYATRFSREDATSKDAVWAEICVYLQRFVVPGAPVLDVATDRGHFIRNIRASERWATDIRDVRCHLPPEIRFAQVSGTVMTDALPSDYFGTVFMSNYLEHLAGPDVVVEQLRQAYAVCRPGGRLVILQPNIRLVRGAYWDFLDHRTALTEKSLMEAAELAGFTTTRVITRFLPFTTKSRLPQAAPLVRLYLRFPPAWLLLGKQTLYVGERLPTPGVE